MTLRRTSILLALIAGMAFADEPGVIRPIHNPGSPGHYRNHVQGRYALRDGIIIKLTHVFGTVIRKVDENRVLVTERIDRFERNQLATVCAADTNALPAGEFSVHALPDGFCTCQTDSGGRITLPAYRIVPTMTFEQYMGVFSNKTTEVPVVRLDSLERQPQTEAQQGGGHGR